MIPENKICKLPNPSQCVCKQAPGMVRECLYLGDAYQPAVSVPALAVHTSGYAATMPAHVPDASVLDQPGKLAPTGAESPPAAIPEAPARTHDDAVREAGASAGFDVDAVRQVHVRDDAAHAYANEREAERKAARNRADRIAVEESFERVQTLLERCATANKNLEADPRSPKLRRMQRNAFLEYAQAQFELEISFDRVPPRVE